MPLADSASAASITQGWVTVGLTAVLVIITAWTTYLNLRLTRSTEASAESAKVAAEASRSAALVGASTARVDFDLEREYAPRGRMAHTAISGMTFRASGHKRAKQGYDLECIYIAALDAAVYVHGAALTRVGSRHEDSTSMEQSVEIALRGPAHPRLVHAGEAIAFAVPTISGWNDHPDSVFADAPLDLVACRVTYSFDGEGPLRERMVANYEYDQGLDV